MAMIYKFTTSNCQDFFVPLCKEISSSSTAPSENEFVSSLTSEQIQKIISQIPRNPEDLKQSLDE